MDHFLYNIHIYIYNYIYIYEFPIEHTEQGRCGGQSLQRFESQYRTFLVNIFIKCQLHVGSLCGLLH